MLQMCCTFICCTNHNETQITDSKRFIICKENPLYVLRGKVRLKISFFISYAKSVVNLLHEIV